MVETLTMDSGAGSEKLNRTSTLLLYRSLVWKELRETGFYALVMIAAGLGLVAMSQAMSLVMGGYLWEQQIPRLIYIFPVLMVLACGSTCFAMEHENGSFECLRALPISSSQIFLVKLITLLVIAASSGLIFWPLMLWMMDSEWSLLGLTANLLSMGEAFLWALLFSLRGKRVIPTLIKSCFGFLLASCISLVGQLAIYEKGWDTVFFCLELGVRSGVAVALMVGIQRSIGGWLVDSSVKTGTTAKRFAKNSRIIEQDRSLPLPAFRRLVWLQWRQNRLALSVLAGTNIGAILVTQMSGGGHPLLSGIFGQLIAVVSIAFLGVIAARSCGAKISLVLNSGYRVRQVWAAHSLTILVFCLISTAWASQPQFLFNTYVPEGISPLVYYLTSCLMAYAVGQFSSLICRSTLTAFVLAVFFLCIALPFYSLSVTRFDEQLPSLITFCLLPLLLTAAYMRRRVTTRRLGARFWVISPMVLMLSLAPLPLMRVYGKLNADVYASVEVLWKDTVDFTELSYRNGLFYRGDAMQPFTGTAYDRWPNGRMRMRQPFVSGKEHGWTITWFDDGKKSSLGEREFGKQIGIWTYWDEDGDEVQWYLGED